MSKFILIFTYLSLVNLAYSQDQTIAYNDSLVKFENSLVNNALYYENKYWNTTNIDTQYFINDYTNSTLSYQGNVYKNIQLKFDILQNKILFKPKFEIYTELSLLNDNIDYFIINNKKFIRFYLNDSNLYFEENYINDKINLYIYHIKILKENLTNEQLKYTFYNKYDYFISINNNLIKIINKKTFFEIFPDKKNEINKFFKENTTLKNHNLQLFYNKLLIFISNN